MIRRTINLVQSKKEKKDYKYKQYINLILERYNESPHQSLFNNMPYDVYKNGKKLNYHKRLSKILNQTKKIVLDVLKKNDRVLISRVKNNIFEKSSLRQWKDETFVIYKVLLTDPVTYKLPDLNGEEIEGSFYREELRKL